MDLLAVTLKRREHMRLLACIAAFLLMLGPAFAQAPICFKTSSSQIGCTPVTTTTSPLPVTGVITGTAAVTQSGTWTVQPGNTANTTPWLVTDAGDSFTNVTTNTDTVIKASAGTFKGISVNTLGTTSTVVVYNNTTCTGAKIGTFSTILQNAIPINAAASTGICVTTAGAGAADITVYYR